MTRGNHPSGTLVEPALVSEADREILLLRQALAFYADPAHYAIPASSTRVSLTLTPEGETITTSPPIAVIADRGKIARTALAPQPAANTARNRSESGSGRPPGPKRATGAGVPATGRKTEGIER